jgi:ribosome recycling factor
VLDEVISDARRRMERSVESTRHEFGTVRTGRASTSLLDRIQVDAYGSKMPLNQLATISAPEARLLVIMPFDKGTMRDIEKAIQESDLGLTPSNDGKLIRLAIPQLTEERRREFVKVVHGEAGADDTRRGEERVQKLTDEHIASIDSAAKNKEAEILEV